MSIMWLLYLCVLHADISKHNIYVNMTHKTCQMPTNKTQTNNTWIKKLTGHLICWSHELSLNFLYCAWAGARTFALSSCYLALTNMIVIKYCTDKRRSVATSDNNMLTLSVWVVNGRIHFLLYPVTWKDVSG